MYPNALLSDLRYNIGNCEERNLGGKIEISEIYSGKSGVVGERYGNR